MPLFFISVKTNVNYCVVGVFMPEHEDAASIKEAIDVFKSWNENWRPQDFITDCCWAEINAIESAFEDVLVRLCKFHREKAWNEWLARSENGIGENREMLKGLMRDIAESTTEAGFNWAYNELQQSNIWKVNPKLRRWFQNSWLSEKSDG
ncbi:uncharacterized protein LOC141906453 [Tubulanus polymorphus]|uniref:uncharacterized protein LOC141906453 n=1 Tax=Tubulanus polymorphus TaxID=672921 RepID=UPI003DA68162